MSFRAVSNLIALILLLSLGAEATVIIAVPARDGLVVCADKLEHVITTYPYAVSPSNSSGLREGATKLHPIGEKGIWVVTGDKAYIRSDGAVIYDADAIVSDFFLTTHRNVDEKGILEFEPFLVFHFLEDLTAVPVSELPPEGEPPSHFKFDLAFFWITADGSPHEHYTRLFYEHPRHAWVGNADAKPEEFSRTKPFVIGSGYLFYKELEQGNDPRFEKWRKDKEIRILIDGNLPSNALSTTRASKLIKRLIRATSDGGSLLQPPQEFSEDSDCMLLPHTGSLKWLRE